MALFTAIGTALGATAASAFGVGVAATAVGASAVGGLATSIMSASKSSKGSEVSMPQSPTAPSVEDAAAKAKAGNKLRQASAARNETVYTSPLGVAAEAATAKKTLLGQ
jgi:hypothetical protein